MKIEAKCRVGLVRCAGYDDRPRLKEVIDTVFQAIGFSITTGARILLKPNLVAVTRGSDQLACSSPQMIAAVAEWCLDMGAKVKIGDSPAFGSAETVMQVCGITEILRPLAVEPVSFKSSRPIKLACGLTVPIADQALNCDLVLNLPRVKAHNQLLVSLALKNYFGVVSGWRKAWHHAVNGDVGTRFEELLVDLVQLFPTSCSLVDGIVAMHRTGPMHGDPYALGLVGASFAPAALDTAIMRIIGADFTKSQLWVESRRRAMVGTDPADIEYPLLTPDDLLVKDFILPGQLSPVTFNPGRIIGGICRRAVLGILK